MDKRIRENLRMLLEDHGASGRVSDAPLGAQVVVNGGRGIQDAVAADLAWAYGGRFTISAAAENQAIFIIRGA